MLKSISILLFTLVFASPSHIDKLGFYTAFESNSQEKMEKKLDALSKLANSTNKDAYIGALTMKKSQFLETPKAKVEAFKEGRVLLENAISKEPNNAEFRFLRFAIQENVPKVIKYTSNIDEDMAMIIQSYPKMDVTLKKVIKEYSKQSKHLSSDRLK